MKKQTEKILNLFIRYFSLLLMGIGNFYVLYKILIPLTTHIVNAVLLIFTDTTLTGNVIYLSWTGIEIAPACVAGSAFYLLLLLVLSTANIKPVVRTKMVLTTFAMLFFLNIIRILILIPMTGANYFGVIHWIFWHLISIVFVVSIWFYAVKTYKIKSVPIYSDLKYLMGLIKPVKKSKRKKKHN
ncbi:MAG: pacearchaeosortase [Nanoarchaeota archaeon]|nr:pacearchaeosortase [Nanoarchaeota archaeon]